MFEYEIGGKTYVQKPLVWGQVKQLTNLLKDVEFSADATPITLIGVIGDKMGDVLAVVLTEKDKHVKDKNVKELAEELSFEVSPELVIRVIEDFFDCNPTGLYLEKIANLFGKVTEQAEKSIPPIT